MYSILANANAAGGAGGMIGMILWLVIIFGIMYFIMIRPQKKEQKKKELMLSEVAVGDTVLTISGFYGTIIDIVDDTVIVEFGNNRTAVFRCRRQQSLRLRRPQKLLSPNNNNKGESSQAAPFSLAWRFCMVTYRIFTTIRNSKTMFL